MRRNAGARVGTGILENNDVDAATRAANLDFVVRDNQKTQMQSVHNCQVLAIFFQPSAGIEFTSGNAGDQRDGFGLVFSEFAIDEGHLRGMGKADVFGTDFAAAQDPLLGPRLINVDAAR